ARAQRSDHGQERSHLRRARPPPCVQRWVIPPSHGSLHTIRGNPEADAGRCGACILPGLRVGQGGDGTDAGEELCARSGAAVGVTDEARTIKRGERRERRGKTINKCPCATVYSLRSLRSL